jgi:single-stranded-DNA-specific exonuclease
MPPSPVSRQWIIAAPHAQRAALAASARVSPLIAQVLLNRGVTEPAAVQRFLNPDFRELLPPETLPGATDAAARLLAAARAGRRIVIYGDYDVDGVTATAILWHALRLAGAEVSFYIPSRFDEGYGVNAEALAQLRVDGADLVVTVDCGITAVAEAAGARALGLELIITDHHQPQAELPDVAAIVHPTACGASPNPHLSGAAVAMKVAWALAQQACGGRASAEWRELLLDATAFAALGLVADVVPLTGENRVIATYGLKQLAATQNLGLRALIAVSGLSGKGRYDDYDVGFALAPRLNALGRMGHARLAVEMFTRAGAAQAEQIATTLDGQNRARQSVERAIVKQAEARVVERGFDRDSCRAIVLADTGWHPGVIGIVAARMVDRFHRPTVLIALDNGVGQGSGRSVKHFPLHEVLESCSQHLISHGGHAMAAGLRLKAEDVDAFTDAFLAEAARRLTLQDLCPKLHLDDEVPLGELVVPAVELLQRLAPFGPDNPRVRLATTPVTLVGAPRAVGTNGQHLQFSVQQGREQRKAIAFGRGRDAAALADCPQLRVAFEPLINEFNGQRRVELRVLDWQPVP